jgi:PHD/YefM family antitoxin component YafN of YafNO toxin-antitoxin module
MWLTIQQFMINLPTTQVSENFEPTLDQVVLEGERIILQRNGKAVAALVSIEDLEILEQLEGKLDLEAAQEALQEPGTVSWESVKASLGL